MLLLVAKAHQTLTELNPPRNVGRFCGPRNYHRMADTVREGFLWAADNDAYNGFDPGKFVEMLNALKGLPGCLFVACPDVVGDADGTRDLFAKWYRAFWTRELPLGYVAQDGAVPQGLPWSDLNAVFIGGSTEWKLGEDAALIVKDAKSRGKWVHMGRVNTWRRIQYAASIGVDSIDGTKYSMFTDTYLNVGAEMSGAHRQGVLVGEGNRE